MRIGFFGGTFDPPHFAHAAAVLWALQCGEVDRVLVVPTARHAFGKEPDASFAHRIAMCRLAMADFGESLVEVSTIEGERDTVSYTVDTLRELRAWCPGATWRLIVGTDIVDDLPKWRESDAIQKMAPPLEVPRIVDDIQDASRGVRPGALPMLSSTTVRDRLASGQDISGLVPARVVAYMREQGLYGFG